MWNFRKFVIKNSMAEYRICFRQLFHAEVLTVFCVHIDVCRSASVEFQRKDSFVGFNLTEAFVFHVLHHRNSDTFHRNVIGDVPTVYLLVYQMAYFVISPGSSDSQNRQLPVISFGQSRHIVARSRSTCATDNNRFSCLSSHATGKISCTAFIHR